MVKANLYSATGTKAAQTQALPPEIFGIEVKSHQLLHEVVRAHQADKRRARAATLTRAQVRGGGKKPWRQKGLGRARVGSIRSPIWRGGGVTFGPTGDQNYDLKLAKN